MSGVLGNSAVGNLKCYEVTGSSISIAWNTVEDFTNPIDYGVPQENSTYVQIDYRLHKDPGDSTGPWLGAGVNIPPSEKAFTIYGVQPDTTYDIRVTNTDGLGNFSVSTLVSATTLGTSSDG